MPQDWLIDPKPDTPRERSAGPARSSFESESDLILAVDSLLRRRRFRDALDRLGPLGGNQILEPAFRALRSSALAGLGRLDEAEAELSEARLRRGRGVWEETRLTEDASRAITAMRRAERERSKARQAVQRKAAKAVRAPSRLVVVRAAAVLPDAPVDLRVSIARRPDADLAPDLTSGAARAFADYRLRLEAAGIDRLRRFDTLLSLAAAHGVDHYEYQLRTVRRVLRDFRGRALLADEVGLGKTVEACLCLEEYLQRGLVRRALLLVPPGLLAQWKDELAGKFGREVVIVDGSRGRDDPLVWERDPLVLASMALARNEPHASRLLRARFDMVVVDEAHRLKNRSTRLWQLVDQMHSRFLLLLSATPVENDVMEIYNVLSLLRPGLFPTPAEFRKAFVEPGRRTPKDPMRLRVLLREVMIRNTRAVSEARLPPRFATTLRATPSPEEAEFHTVLGAAVRGGLEAGTLSRFAAGEVLRGAGSRPPAAAGLIERHLGAPLADRARAFTTTGKDALLLDLLAKRPDDKVIVFASHRETLDHLMALSDRAARRPVLFHGSLSPAGKAEAIAEFAGDKDVLVASESGGEGFNLHFARTVVNYDLPWNPMRIEQRIGRVHRIGQARDVFVFNLVAAGTLEEEILRVLDEKINMFELVVGEVEAVLGRLGDDEKEFADLVLDIYAAAKDGADLRARFDALAERMIEAKGEHLRVRALEEKTFGRDLEA